MAAKFSVYKDKAGKYRFNLKASNGEIIATGESYPDKKSALKGIASIQKNAAAAKISDDTGEAEAPKTRGRKSAAAKAAGVTEKPASKPRGRPAMKNIAATTEKAAPKTRGRPAAKNTASAMEKSTQKPRGRKPKAL